MKYCKGEDILSYAFKVQSPSSRLCGTQFNICISQLVQSAGFCTEKIPKQYRKERDKPFLFLNLEL